MKIAQLPDGKQVSFPADMDDAAIDNMVKAHLGTGREATQAQMFLSAMQMFEAFVQATLQAHQATIQELGAIRGVLDNMAQYDVKECAENKKSTAKLISTLNDISKALRAKKTIIEKDGKPVGVTTE